MLLTASGKALQAVLGKRHQVMKVCVGNPWLGMFPQSHSCATAQLLSDGCWKCHAVPQGVIRCWSGDKWSCQGFNSLFFLWLVGPILGWQKLLWNAPPWHFQQLSHARVPRVSLHCLASPKQVRGISAELVTLVLKKHWKIWLF